MKTTITSVFLVAILTFPFYSLAQRHNTSFISLDLGMNSTWILNQNMYGNPELAYSPRTSFSGGLSYKHSKGGYGYSVGLGYLSLGQKYAGEMAGTAAQRRVSLSYMKFPVMVMHNFGGKQTWVSFGPQLMYLISAQQDFNRKGGRPISNPELMNEGSTDVISRFNLIDVMLAFELTHVFTREVINVLPYKSADKIMFSLSLDGAIGLTDINQKEYQLSNTHNLYGGSHNFYLGIQLGMMLNRPTEKAISHHNKHRGYNESLSKDNR